MILNFHQTASCPKCGKDSYCSLHEAIFVPVKCPHCKCVFKFDAKNNQTREIKK